MFVNGKATTSSGVHRRYVSRGLRSGFSYTYEVRVEGEIGGEMVSETKTVQITAGQESKLAFELKADFETMLTLNVPKDGGSLPGRKTVPRRLAMCEFTAPSRSNRATLGVTTKFALFEK